MADNDVNPFADPGDINPFGDPAVTTVTNAPNKGLDEYNPFAEQGAVVAPPPVKTEPVMPAPQPFSQPATLEPVRSEPAPPAYTSYASQSDQESLKRRQEDLEKKASELQRKEQELKTLQQQIHRENNFPPLPKKCCVGPCFFHDISIDIPIESQKTCRMMFYLWQLYSFTLVYNTVCALALLCTDSSYATTFAVSILYLVLFVPCSFMLWYWPVYKALRSDSSFNYMLFFFCFFFQIIFSILYALGIPSFGTCGWINASRTLKSNKAVAVMMFICAILFSLEAVLQILLLKRIHNFYRTSGASLQKAQGEFARGVMTNKHVQSAAADAVREGVTAQGTKY